MAKLKGVLVDSTYILPAFGIKVSEISNEDLERLDRAYKLGLADFYFSEVVWVEVLPKVLKEYARKGLVLEPKVVKSVVSLVGENFQRVMLGETAIELAVKLRGLGHGDMVDNLLYGAAVENNLYFMTVDTAFREFLEKHGLKHPLINHHELLGLLGL